jgi:hypothetical protein
MAKFLRTSVPFLLLVAACGLYRLWAAPAQPPLEFTRRVPWTIGPRYDIPEIATDSQLFAVLDRMKPPMKPINTNLLVHALRLWGAAADFGDEKVLSGAQMRDYYLNDAQFRHVAGEDVSPLFTQDRDGVRARAWIDGDQFRDTSAVHTDDLLATLAETGTPLDTPLMTRDGPTTVAQLLEGALSRFHLTQQEYEWSAISFARYALPLTAWRNQFGEKITVDDLVDELITHPLREGVCGGTHRLEALVVLYRADEQAQVLSRRTKRKILDHLSQVSALLVAGQHAEGYWTRDWDQGHAKEDSQAADGEDRILLTGHHLEWLALAPAEVQPPRETIVRAGQWLVRAMTEVDQATLAKRYGPFTHAARALCLWRSKDPFEAWKSGQQLVTSN